MFLQGSLFGLVDRSDAESQRIERTWLDGSSWVDTCPSWLAGADDLFDELHQLLPWRQRTGVKMYDRYVDEPRLVHWWSTASGAPEPLPVLGTLRHQLGERYGVVFDSIGFNLYRDGDDSVAWHGDRHRRKIRDPIVAIVSVGGPRPFRLRPRGGGSSRSWNLGHGDLFVMGGACQHDWEHCVPKLRSAEPRVSITFRHDAR
jgi:alkylated DNA repair dioxygenase AlkB